MVRLLRLVVVTMMTAACLPRGAPPAGRHIVADREVSLGAIVPANGDGVLRILLIRHRPEQDVNTADLTELFLDADNNPSPERLLVPDIDSQSNLGCIWRVAPCSFDANGTALVLGTGTSGAAVRVDTVTGESEPVNGNAFTTTSPSGERSFTLDAAYANTGTLQDADGRTTAISLAPPPTVHAGPYSVHYQFAGEDFYYLDPQNGLFEVPPAAPPRIVAAGITNFTATATPDGALLTLTRTASDPTVQQTSVRDPVTRQETLLPFGDNCTLQFSTDWRWLLCEQSTFDGQSFSRSFTLFDLRTGASQTLDISPAARVQWRPGHDELWASTSLDDPSPGISILTPDGPTITVPNTTLYSFTLDGSAWFSTTDFNSSTPAMLVGSADDPTGPLFPFNPPGTAAQHQWVLSDGRVLAAFSPKDPQRGDVIAVDPRTGDSRLLAEGGLVAALGQTRLMGMFRFQEGRGDLTTVDLETGNQTILAPEFTITAFAEAQGTNQLAPGTRIVYQFQARTASPYDGIWLAESP